MTRTRPTRALALPALLLLAGVAVAGCSDQDATAPEVGADAPAATDEAAEPEADAGDFCTAYDDAGGTLATPGTFQVGMPAEQTIADLSSRLEVLDAATPPDDIAADWQTLHDLYAEVVTIAEQVPAEEPVVDPRVLEIAGDLREPGTAVRNHLDENC
jgi:hypothetical protein